MEQTLGFRVIQWQGAWQIQVLDEQGKVTKVKPCLYKEIWELWTLATEQHAAIQG